MQGIIFFLSAILFIFPIIVQLKNYVIVKSTSYILFATLLFLSFINKLISSLASITLFLHVTFSINFIVIHIILIYISSEFVDHKLPFKTVYWQLIALLTLVGLLSYDILAIHESNSEYHLHIEHLIGAPLRILSGIILMYSVWKSKLLVKNKRTIYLRSSYFTIGFVISFAGVIQFLFFGTYLLMGNSLIDAHNIADMTVAVAMLINAILIIILAVFFPESMLFSQTQILKAAKLYDIFHKSDKNDMKSLMGRLTEASEVFLEYINEIRMLGVNDPEK